MTGLLSKTGALIAGGVPVTCAVYAISWPSGSSIVSVWPVVLCPGASRTPPGTVLLRLISQLPLALCVPLSGVPVKPCAGSRIRKIGTSKLNWLMFSIVTS